MTGLRAASEVAGGEAPGLPRPGRNLTRATRSSGGKRPGAFGVFLGTLLLCGWPFVMAGVAAAQTGAPLRHARVRTSGPDTHQGVVTKLEKGRLTLVGEQTHELAVRDLDRVDFSDRTPVLPIDAPLLILANGDILVASVVEGDQETLRAKWVQLSALRDFTVPVEAVRAIVLRPPTGAEAGRLLWKRLADNRNEQDELILKTGDTLTGELKRIATDSLHLDGEGTAGRVAREGIVAVTFNAEFAELEPLKGAGALVTLIDGSRFHVSEIALVKGDLLSFKTLFGADFVMPAAAVCGLRFLGGCATLVSEMEPTDAEFTPYLSIDWPWRRDRNCLAQPLRLRGVDYANGLGVHSRQRLKFPLDGKYREFRATVGIDDSAKGAGSVLFEVKVDGKSVWKSDVVRGADEPLTVDNVDLKGARELELFVDFGPRGDILDHANWCDAVLIR
ncbi:MAG: NPCBM/NEW2 domain-containing protein [Planctomycetota bacterium]|nr:NPCBM/NEW2 domain-containing protein [Planctomycetota bacterium]